MGEISRVEGEPTGFGIGRLLGRREAFAAVSGRCSAAEAESLRRVRDEKAYRELGLTWEEFCEKRLGASRRNIDRTLRLLDEFGPQFFHVAQMAHVTVDEYRAIASNVSAEGVKVGDAVIALLPENSEQVSAAIAGLLKREKPLKAGSPPAVEAILKRCEALREAIERMSVLGPMDGCKVAIALSNLREAATKKGAQYL